MEDIVKQNLAGDYILRMYNIQLAMLTFIEINNALIMLLSHSSSSVKRNFSNLFTLLSHRQILNNIELKIFLYDIADDIHTNK